MFVIVWRITIYGACQITKSERGIIKKKGPMDHEVFYCQKKGSQTQKRGKLCATKYKNEREGYHYTNKFSEGSKNFTKLHLNICVK